MKIVLPILVCCALVFSGCFSVFESLRFHPDGTISVGRDMGIDDMFFTLTESFSKLLDDSTKAEKPKVNLLDSMKDAFSIDESKLPSIPGYMGYVQSDTSIDGQHHFMAEIHIRDTSAMLAAKQLLYPDSTKSKKSASGGLSFPKGAPFSDNGKGTGFHTKVYKVPGRTIVDVSFTLKDEDVFDKSKKKKKAKDTETEMAKSFIKKIEFGYKIYSQFLLPSSDIQIVNIPGGQEWKLPLEEMIGLKKGKTYHHQFVITQ